MGAYSGPEISNDGLVFHFDMGNTDKSWKGAPTTNLTTDTPSQGGWMGSYSLIDSSTKTFYITTQQNSSTTSAWRTWYWDVSAYVGSTLTISMDVKWISNVNADFLHVTVGQGNTGQYPIHIAGSNSIDRVQVGTIPYEKIHMTWTGLINSAGLVGVTQWINNVTTPGDSVTLEISNVQIEVSAFETPFVNGTRSSTEAILDMTGQNIITPSNLSYNSDDTFEFDGTDDYIDFSIPSLTTVATIEMWASVDFSDAGMMIGFRYYDVYLSNGLGFNTANADLYGINSSKVTSRGLNNQMRHYVFEMRSDVSYTNNKIYIDGENISLSQIYGTENSGNRHFNSGDGSIGRWRSNGTGNLYYQTMDCPSVKIYNRALSPQEVKNNYLATKSRYGL
jgi:hypothetical protein